MIDFSLSPSQAQVREQAVAFATQVLSGARNEYTKLPNDGVARFQSTQPLFEKATQLGIIKSLVPKALGGTGGTLLDTALIVEELFAVEPGVSITIFSVGLGLSPLFLGGSPQLQEKILRPFLSGEGAPLASLDFSEPNGSANYMEPGGKGMTTTATRQGDGWIVNGEKIWASNIAGWDMKGATLQTIFCRNPEIDSSQESAMLMLATPEVLDANDPGAFTILRHVESPGFTACSGPHIKFTNLRIPNSLVLATGRKAVALIEGAFTGTAAMVGAMGVGIMRAAFDSALHFAKTRDQGGSIKLIERQTVADLLIEIKMRIETARLLTWKAANALDSKIEGAEELAYEAKIYSSEACVKSVAEAMRVVGISSYSMEYRFGELMADALVLPIFDGGNQGVRRRQVQSIFAKDSYNPWKVAFSGEEESK